MTFLQKHPILGSSADADKVSMTIKSVGAWVVVGIVALAKIYDMDIAESDLTTVINNVAVIAGAVMGIYGIGRKIYYKFFGVNYAK